MTEDAYGLVSDHEIESPRPKVSAVAREVDRLRGEVADLMDTARVYWTNYAERTGADYRAMNWQGRLMQPKQVAQYVRNYWTARYQLLEQQQKRLMNPAIEQTDLDQIRGIVETLKGQMVEMAYQFRLALITP